VDVHELFVVPKEDLQLYNQQLVTTDSTPTCQHTNSLTLHQAVIRHSPGVQVPTSPAEPQEEVAKRAHQLCLEELRKT